MKKTSRRNFIKRAGLSAAAGSSFLAGEVRAMGRKSSKRGNIDRLTLGMASYTFRQFSLDDTIAMTQRLGLQRIAFKSFHLALDSSESEIKSVAGKVRAAGLDLYGCGVVYMRNEAEVNQAFEYAKTAGMEMIIGVPNHELLGLTNEKVKQYDIQVAIHNHGPGDKLYPSPESAYERITDLDPRIGLCLDIGHTKRIGIDPSEAAKLFSDRLLDVHIKDVSSATAEGTTVEIGRGVIDIPKFIDTLLKLNYTGTASLEFEKDEDDPLPGSAESIGFVRGVLAVI